MSEQQWKNEMAAAVAFKEARIQAHQADREQMIQEVSINSRDKNFFANRVINIFA